MEGWGRLKSLPSRKIDIEQRKMKRITKKRNKGKKTKVGKKREKQK